MLRITLGILISYLVGSIPWAYIFGRLLKGIDIRQFGSGNVGATNALRVLGRGPGIVVLVLDILKGLLTVVILGQTEILSIVFGLCCICGHNWTVFLKFKGGKGVATTLGVLLGLAIKISGLGLILGLLAITWFGVFGFWKIISLSSVVTAIVFPVYTVLFRRFLKQPNLLICLSVILSILIILRHKSNLKRLLQGKEPRI
jgi:glycerol-3-phosphate acyltransferase PlsY